MCDMNAAMLRQVSSTKTDAQINRTYPNLVWRWAHQWTKTIHYLKIWQLNSDRLEQVNLRRRSFKKNLKKSATSNELIAFTGRKDKMQSVIRRHFGVSFKFWQMSHWPSSHMSLSSSVRTMRDVVGSMLLICTVTVRLMLNQLEVECWIRHMSHWTMTRCLPLSVGKRSGRTLQQQNPRTTLKKCCS